MTKGILLSLALCAGIWLASGATATPATPPSTTKKKTAKKVTHAAPAGAKTTAIHTIETHNI